MSYLTLVVLTAVLIAAAVATVAFGSVYDQRKQLESEEQVELERYAAPFWPLIYVALLLALLIWSMS